MADQLYFPSIPAKKLKTDILSTDSVFKLRDIKWYTGSDAADVSLSSSIFGPANVGYGVFEPNTPRQEFFTFNPTNMAVATTTGLTIVARGLPWGSDYTTEATARKFNHASGSVVLLMTNAPALYDKFANKTNDESITGIWTFTQASAMPRLDSAHTYGAGEEEYLATKRYVDGVVTGGAADMSTTAKGLAEEATQAEVDAGTAAGGTLARLAVNPSTVRAKKYHDFAASAGGTDAYAITITPVITAYADGQVFTFEADVANTGAATLAVSGLAAKAIKKYGAKDLETNDIIASQIVQVVYDLDSDTFQLQTPVAKQQVSQSGAEIYGADAGANDTYTATLSPAPTAYASGQVYRIYCNTANTGAATLNINALGAKDIRKNGSAALETGDILAGQVIEVVYEAGAGYFQLISPVATMPKVYVGTFSLSASGSLSITGVGFKPKIVQFFAVLAPSFGADQALNVMSGGATSASNEFVVEGYVSDNAGATGASSSTTASIIIRAGASASTITEQADFTSMDTDGFTINVSTFTSPRTIGFVAIG